MRNTRLTASLFLLLAAATSTLSFEKVVTSNGTVRLSGWVRVHGEIMVYPDRLAMMEDALYPRCLSAHFGQRGTSNLKKYDRKKVTVVGELYDYDMLPNDDAPLVSRKILDGVTIPNQCFGMKVMLLKSVSIIS